MTDVLVVADHRQGALRDVSYELITAGWSVTTGELDVVVVGGAVGSFVDDLNREGVDTVHAVDHGEEFNHDVTHQAVVEIVEDLQPRLVMMPHSVNGLDYAPAVATTLDVPLVSDVVGIERDGDRLLATREMYGSKVEATIESEVDRVALTLRPNEWPAARAAGDGEVRTADVTIDESAIRSRVTGFEAVDAGDVDITQADVLVSIGRGIEDDENLDLVFDLADAMGATVSASRPIVDNGWLEKGRQVGQSGKVVTPDVYLAIGISGAVQHVAGMKSSDTIVAINTDPNAPIFDIADYGIVGDLFDVVPALIEEFSG